MPLIDLDFVGTLAAAGLVLFAGYGLQRRVSPLARYNIPAPVIGGLLVALAVTLLRAAGHQPVTFDTTLQAPLMIAFFTSIGFGASVPSSGRAGRRWPSSWPSRRRLPCSRTWPARWWRRASASRRSSASLPAR